MHLALGHGEMASFKVSDFAAYERQVRHRLVEFVGGDHGAYPFADPYPEPVEHCAICRWRRTCTARRRDDDDLSLVAGIARRQRQELKAAGITTRRALAACATAPRPSQVRTRFARPGPAAGPPAGGERRRRAGPSTS